MKVIVDLDVRRGDMMLTVSIAQVQDSRLVSLSGASQMIRIGESDVFTLVMREVQIVPAKGIGNLLGYLDQRRPVDVGSHPAVHMGTDDRSVEESGYLHSMNHSVS